MAPALKNMVIVIRTLMSLRPFKFSKIRGYAHNVVMVRETKVQITVKITVHTKDQIYFISVNTIS
jgi:hypothetical protein